MVWKNINAIIENRLYLGKSVALHLSCFHVLTHPIKHYGCAVDAFFGREQNHAHIICVH